MELNIDLIFSLGETGIGQKVSKPEEEGGRKHIQKEHEATWYHEGPESLRTARLFIAHYSLPVSLNQRIYLRKKFELLY